MTSDDPRETRLRDVGRELAEYLRKVLHMNCRVRAAIEPAHCKCLALKLPNAVGEAANLVKTYPEMAVIPVDTARMRRPGAFLVRQDDQVLINFLNQWIEVQKLNGFFDQLYAKWQIAR